MIFTMSQIMREEGLERILSQINELRHLSLKDNWRKCHSIVEEVIEALFNASNHLVIYGSLAPGKTNHHVIEDIAGQWLRGYVHGELHENGWGSDLGFPGIVWFPNGPKVDVHLFVSEELPMHWRRLDHFEGEGYKCSLVPVYGDKELIAIANTYEIRHLS
jgi:gamma-glutamylcyclotransferase (GGCT)/AIG2-like uncharacterized protein YtfP